MADVKEDLHKHSASKQNHPKINSWEERPKLIRVVATVSDLVELDLQQDGDVCQINELNNSYRHPYYSASRKAIGLEKLFILNLDSQWQTNKLAAALSNNSVYLSTCDTLEKITTFVAHDQNIIDLHFNPNDPNSLFTASNNGSIRLWDIRTPQKYSLELKGK